MVARARYMEVRAEARYYQDVLDGTGADYQPYAAHRAETSRSQRSQGVQPQPVGPLQGGGERQHRDQQGDRPRAVERAE
ncbi:hypothetical protein KI387_035252, partial [Taxus chinensis]